MVQDSKLIVFFDGQMARSNSITAVKKVKYISDDYRAVQVWLTDCAVMLEFECENDAELDRVFRAVNQEIKAALKIKSIIKDPEDIKKNVIKLVAKEDT